MTERRWVLLAFYIVPWVAFGSLVASNLEGVQLNHITFRLFSRFTFLVLLGIGLAFLEIIFFKELWDDK